MHPIYLYLTVKIKRFIMIKSKNLIIRTNHIIIYSVWRVMIMTEQQKFQIIKMREKGTSFSKISDVTGISRNTVKSFCRRHNIARLHTDGASDKLYCKECGAALSPKPGRKIPKFCSSECRTAWWNSHPEAVNRKAVYAFTCACCGKPFTAYGNRGRKFCSRQCYITARFKAGSTECGGHAASREYLREDGGQNE